MKSPIDSSTLFFHGTDAYFETFKDRYRGSNTFWDNTVHGFFFSEKKENAQMFGNTIITANLEILKTLDLRLQSIFKEERQASLIWKMLSGERLKNCEALVKLDEEIGIGELGEMRDSLNNEIAHKMMVAAGYDSIISDFGDNQPEYIVFKAKQIRIISIDRSSQERKIRR